MRNELDVIRKSLGGLPGRELKNFAGDEIMNGTAWEQAQDSGPFDANECRRSFNAEAMAGKLRGDRLDLAEIGGTENELSAPAQVWEDMNGVVDIVGCGEEEIGFAAQRGMGELLKLGLRSKRLSDHSLDKRITIDQRVRRLCNGNGHKSRCECAVRFYCNFRIA